MLLWALHMAHSEAMLSLCLFTGGLKRHHRRAQRKLMMFSFAATRLCHIRVKACQIVESYRVPVFRQLGLRLACNFFAFEKDLGCHIFSGVVCVSSFA